MSAFVAASRVQHIAHVKTLYRRLLRNSMSLVLNMDEFALRATFYRAEIEKHRDETDPAKIYQLKEELTAYIAKYKTPDPYKLTHSPGSTSYQRNVPIPPELTTPRPLYWTDYLG